MDIDKAKEILANTSTDFDIKNRVLIGMAILASYVVSGAAEPRFEHDQMWYINFEETVVDMSESTVTTLAELGWFEDEEAWSHS